MLSLSLFFIGMKRKVICFINIKREFVAFEPSVYFHRPTIYDLLKFSWILVGQKQVSIVRK